jgi:hypothetical protein
MQGLSLKRTGSFQICLYFSVSSFWVLIAVVLRSLLAVQMTYTLYIHQHIYVLAKNVEQFFIYINNGWGVITYWRRVGHETRRATSHRTVLVNVDRVGSRSLFEAITVADEQYRNCSLDKLIYGEYKA